MKKNNKGFIAISLIYSFFLVFLVTLLGITIDYTQNRILLNDVKKTTQEYLNTLSEFNPVKLPSTTYASGEELTYAGEEWIVLEDNGDNVKLILKNSLSNEVINRAFDNNSINKDGFPIPGEDGSSQYIRGPVDDNKVTMCLREFNNRYCSFDYFENFKKFPYTWEKSIVKMVVDDWFENSSVLQKAKDTGNLKVQTFSDEINNYNTYVRIPDANELFDIYTNNDTFSLLTPATEMWNLSHANSNDNGSYISSRIGSEIGILAHTTYKKINPIIVVNKAQ